MTPPIAVSVTPATAVVSSSAVTTLPSERSVVAARKIVNVSKPVKNRIKLHHLKVVNFLC